MYVCGGEGNVLLFINPTSFHWIRQRKFFCLILYLLHSLWFLNNIASNNLIDNLSNQVYGMKFCFHVCSYGKTIPRERCSFSGNSGCLDLLVNALHFGQVTSPTFAQSCVCKSRFSPTYSMPPAHPPNRYLSGQEIVSSELHFLQHAMF